MSKRLIDRFTEDFERHLSGNSHEQAFEKAKTDFENACGFTPYSNLNSYQASRSQDRKKRKKS